MIDWTASMQQTYEFYTVNPNTWEDDKKLTNIKSCGIIRDAEVDTLISATFDITELVGECYIRVYLVVTQNGVTEKHPLGTFLVQTPSSSFDGLVRSVSMDAYSPLLELTEKQPPFGYFINKGSDVMQYAYDLTQANMRAPVNEPFTPSTILHYNFVADTNDTYMSFIKDLIGAASVSKCYEVVPNGEKWFHTQREIEYPYGKNVSEITPKGTLTNRIFSYTNDNNELAYFTIVESGYIQYKLEIDGMGKVTFVPNLEAKYMTPKWTYTDDNSSILEPSISMDHDLYGIPNVVEVVYSANDKYIESRIVNDDPNSPTSTVNRGREIVHRQINPNIHGEPTQELVDKFAEDLLSELSSVEYTISYTHGYCPVNIGDCVRLNYERAGLMNVKAKVIYQSIKCRTGCTVSEKAVFTNKLWR